MSRTYVIPDIHGRLDLMNLALDKIEKNGSGRVIFTGDFIDRGPESKGVVDRLIAGPPSGYHWSFVRGNHEDMALHCADGTDAEWWIGNGGGETMQSYGGAMMPAHLAWFDSLPRLIWDARRVYVHAGVSEEVPLGKQAEKITQWFRYPDGADVGHHARHVVHGHTPVADGPELLKKRTNLDTGAFFTGRLVVGIFDDDKLGGPIDLIEVFIA